MALEQPYVRTVLFGSRGIQHSVKFIGARLHDDSDVVQCYWEHLVSGSHFLSRQPQCCVSEVLQEGREGILWVVGHASGQGFLQECWQQLPLAMSFRRHFFDQKPWRGCSHARRNARLGRGGLVGVERFEQFEDTIERRLIIRRRPTVLDRNESELRVICDSADFG
ncbi:hypothetical protein KZX45_05935 [Georgenia sp. EYE_87]|uniref:hypothetical protein n=1 Tax=Georgenia sp. EYE_87 TaxID=2853448 RepID=UPI002003E144|nr:hypothetical protein [Georgenia sp. EYE_87]MCK6210080.1 hypothetical protein [Georgenia sp. EYE_87]